MSGFNDHAPSRLTRTETARLIAQQIACETECAESPSGCGCSMAAADAIASTIEPVALATAFEAGRDAAVVVMQRHLGEYTHNEDITSALSLAGTEINSLIAPFYAAAPTTSPEPDAVRNRNNVINTFYNELRQYGGEPYTSVAIDAAFNAALSAPVAGAWQDISTAPEDDRDILVGAWGAANGEDPEPHEKWFQQISSREDRPYRRGYRHRNGACWATHWHPIPAVTVPRNQGQTGEPR